MKLFDWHKLLWIIPVVGAVGCSSHHPQQQPVAVYKMVETSPTPVAVVSPDPAPKIVSVPVPPSTATSTRSDVRVYAAPTQVITSDVYLAPTESITTPVPPPVRTTTISEVNVASAPDDIMVTDQIRRMLEADTARVYRNVDFEVDKGKVIMRGMVPTDQDRMQLQNQIAAMTGVRTIDNKLDVEPRQAQ